MKDYLLYLLILPACIILVASAMFSVRQSEIQYNGIVNKIRSQR